MSIEHVADIESYAETGMKDERLLEELGALGIESSLEPRFPVDTSGNMIIQPHDKLQQAA